MTTLCSERDKILPEMHPLLVLTERYWFVITLGKLHSSTHQARSQKFW